MKKGNKGFTLTEMIVVIAIIGILAAVMIPSVVIYVNRAKQSNDEQLAASMTDEIERFCIDNDADYDNLKASDIRTILSNRDFDLEPSRKVYTYVYDAKEKTVLVVKNDDISSTINVDQSNEPAEYREDMFIIGKGKSKLEKCINALYLADFDDVEIDKLSKETEKQLVNKYLTNTLFVMNDAVIEKELSQDATQYNLVFCEMALNIPNALAAYAPKLGQFEVPELVVTIGDDARTSLQDKILNMDSINSNIYCHEIDMSNFKVDTEGELKGVLQYTFGNLVEDTIVQTFDIETIGYTGLKVVNTTNNPTLYFIVKVTVRYYKLEGLAAEGTVHMLQEVKESNLYELDRYYGTFLSQEDFVNLSVCLKDDGTVKKDSNGKIIFHLNGNADVEYIPEI